MSNDDITFLQMWEELNDNDRQRTELSEALARIEKNHQAMKEALEGLIKHNENLNSAFYGTGTAKAMRAAMNGQKELLVTARQALTLANGGQPHDQI